MLGRLGNRDITVFLDEVSNDQGQLLTDVLLIGLQNLIGVYANFPKRFTQSSTLPVVNINIFFKLGAGVVVILVRWRFLKCLVV